MTLLWVIGLIAYLLLNAIITLAWVIEGERADSHYATVVAVVVLMTFGLPIMIIVFISSMIALLVKGEL